MKLVISMRAIVACDHRRLRDIQLDFDLWASRLVVSRLRDLETGALHIELRDPQDEAEREFIADLADLAGGAA